MEKATPRQLFALFCACKVNTKELSLTKEQASNMIDRTRKGEVDSVRNELVALGATVSGNAKPQQNWRELFDRAHAAGMAALKSHTPRPMTVVGHTNPLDDSSPVREAWHVSEGVCGFAWVVIHPGNCSFACWLRKNKIGHKHYYGGWEIWVSEGGQSMERKQAYAQAFAEVVKTAGIKAYTGSRMD